MRFEALANLWFASLAALILLLYILKARRQEISVPSVFLWRQLLEDVEAATPWQKLRRNLLLYLQILAVVLIAVALARPLLLRGGVQGASTVILIDGSGSMRATDESPSRFEAALKHCAEIVRAMRSTDEFAIILMKDQPIPVVPFGRDRETATASLAALEPGYAAAAFEQSLSLATSILTDRPSPHIVLVSDGGVSTAEDLDIPDGIGFSHIRVGDAQASNLAVLHVGTRTTADEMAALVRIGNFSDTPRSMTVEIACDGFSMAAVESTVEAGATADLTIAGLPHATTVEARLRDAADSLSEDDTLSVVTSGSSAVKALLVTRANTFLEKALSLTPDTELYKIAPEDYVPSAGYSLYVFDGWLPEELPDAPILVFDPPRAVGPIAIGNRIRSGSLFVEADDHPVMSRVEVAEVSVFESLELVPERGAVSLVSRGVSVVAAWDHAGIRGVVIGMDLHDSDWPLSASFPIFVLNAAQWLAPAMIADGPHTAKTPFGFVAPAWVSDAWLCSPTGVREPIERDGGVFTTVPSAPGLYTVELSGAGRIESLPLSVTMDRTESDISVREIGARGGAERRMPAIGRPLWPALALLALAVLSFEWWLYARGF